MFFFSGNPARTLVFFQNPVKTLGCNENSVRQLGVFTKKPVKPLRFLQKLYENTRDFHKSPAKTLRGFHENPVKH